MTDDDRLLEIATRLMAAHVPSGHHEDECAEWSITGADALLKAWRARTGAHEAREQDVSDELLEAARDAADEAANLSHGMIDESRYRAIERDLFRIQRARAAGKGEEK